MKEDLWDHAWEFHFKKAAPEYWRNLDPYWRGTDPPMHRYFHPDDSVWGGHECCYLVVTSFLSDGTMREHYVRINRWPHMSISRTQDWGWEMSNHLYCYTSVPNADKKGICFQYRQFSVRYLLPGFLCRAWKLSRQLSSCLMVWELSLFCILFGGGYGLAKNICHICPKSRGCQSWLLTHYSLRMVMIGFTTVCKLGATEGLLLNCPQILG